eukprot:ANDGO_04231.mRNA.1 Putative methylsterol monooxygenase DDB_G0269788
MSYQTSEVMKSFEAWWAQMVAERGEYAMTTYVPFAFIIGSYILFNLPLFILDLWNPEFLQKYKIQENKPVTLSNLLKCGRKIMFNYFCVMLPLVLLSFPIFRFVGMHADAPLPPLSYMLMQVFCFMLCEDFSHYWMHRLLHHPSVYHMVHNIHHEWTAPFGLTASYAHPIEIILLGFATFSGPLLYGPHVVTFLIWVGLRQALAIETHCGYEFPFSPNKLFPFVGGAAFHDFHHKTINGNFASNFTFWDTLFGTDIDFWESEEKKKRRSDKTD